MKFLKFTFLASFLIASFFIFHIFNISKNSISHYRFFVSYNLDHDEQIWRIILDLYRKNYLDHPIFLASKCYLQRLSCKALQGNYIFPLNVKSNEFLNQFLSGKSMYYKFTVVEGWKFDQLMNALAKDNTIQHTIFKKDDFLCSELNINFNCNVEGMFMPKTYYHKYMAKDVDILRASYNDMQSFVRTAFASASEGKKLLFKNQYELLTLASLVEKETALLEEKSKIAQVLLNRLQIKMPLGLDPSLLYGMHLIYGDKLPYNLTHPHLYTKFNSLYNVYRHTGLPPTPICIPSISSIEAILKPSASSNLFFVSTKNGKYLYADNFKDHKKNIFLSKLQ